MATTRFLCGNCRGPLVAEERFAGRPIRCPRCKALIEVPGTPVEPEYVDMEPEDAELPPEPEPEPPPKPKPKSAVVEQPQPRPAPAPPPRKRKRPGNRPRKKKTGPATGAATWVILGVIGLAVIVAFIVLASRELGDKKPSTFPPTAGNKPATDPPSGWTVQTEAGYRVQVPSDGRTPRAFAADAFFPILPERCASASNLKSVDSDDGQWAVIHGQLALPWQEYNLPRGESQAMLRRFADDLHVQNARYFEASRLPGLEFSRVIRGLDTHFRIVMVSDTALVVVVSGRDLPAADARVTTVHNSLEIR